MWCGNKSGAGREADLVRLFPDWIRSLDKIHWSPEPVIKRAVEWLLPNRGMSLLDIGSGSGKFCLMGSYLRPDCSFYGVEQRRDLVDCSIGLRDQLNRRNVEFTNANFTSVEFRNFDSFYFYNSFFENLPGVETIDDTIDHSVHLYAYYSAYLKNELDRLSTGTRVVTFCSWDDEIPLSYGLQASSMEGRLKFWMKK